MEELRENYQNAMENKLDTNSKFMDFYNVGLLSQYLSKSGVDGLPGEIVADTLKEYARETGYITITGNLVKFTKKGLTECHNPKHDWD